MAETFTPDNLSHARRLLWCTGSRYRPRKVILTRDLRLGSTPLDVCGPVHGPEVHPLLVDVAGGFRHLRIANGFVDVQLSEGALAHVRVEGHAGPVLIRLASGARLRLSGPGADAVRLVGDEEAIAGVNQLA
jgi:hypothetical protein